MAKLDRSHSPTLPPSPFDLEKVRQIYPALDLAAGEMEYFLRAYRATDLLFRRNFKSLMPKVDAIKVENPDSGRLWAALIRLGHLAGDEDIISGPLLRLEHNNERASMACDLLSILLKMPGGRP